MKMKIEVARTPEALNQRHRTRVLGRVFLGAAAPGAKGRCPSRGQGRAASGFGSPTFFASAERKKSGAPKKVARQLRYPLTLLPSPSLGARLHSQPMPKEGDTDGFH